MRGELAPGVPQALAAVGLAGRDPESLSPEEQVRFSLATDAGIWELMSVWCRRRCRVS